MRNRSAKYTVILGFDRVQPAKPGPEQRETLAGMDHEFTRVFGGETRGKTLRGHVNQLPVDYVYRIMGTGADPKFTFNCHLLVTTKNRTNHHVPYMWGKMYKESDLVPGAEDLYILMVPDIHTGVFGRFYGFPEENVTIGIGCDYMGEAKKGMLRMAMYQAKQRGYLGIHAGTKVVRAQNARTGGHTRYGVAILGNSGTGEVLHHPQAVHVHRREAVEVDGVHHAPDGHVLDVGRLPAQDRRHLRGLALDVDGLQVVSDGEEVDLRGQLHRRVAPVAAAVDAELAGGHEGLEPVLGGLDLGDRVVRPGGELRAEGGRALRVPLGDRRDPLHPVQGREVVEVDDVVVGGVRPHDDVADVLRVERDLHTEGENCVCGGRIKDFGSMARAVKVFITDTYAEVHIRQAFYDGSYMYPPAQLEGCVGSTNGGFQPKGLPALRFAWRSTSMGAPFTSP